MNFGQKLSRYILEALFFAAWIHFLMQTWNNNNENVAQKVIGTFGYNAK